MNKLQFVCLALVVSCAFCLAEDPQTAPKEPAKPTSSTTIPPADTTSTTPTTTSTTTTTTTPKPTKAPTKSCSGSTLGMCQCTDKKIICEDVPIKTIPSLLSKSDFTKFYFRNASITTLDFSSLPTAIEILDVSYNKITEATIMPIKKNFDNMKSLNFSYTNLGNLTQNTLIKFINLEVLDLSFSKLKNIHEDAFASLTKLKVLNLTGLEMRSHLGDRQFSKNQKLEYVNLSNSSLVEVPFALRSTSSIKTLVLNYNSMTSLRHSDFINRTNLNTLEIRFCDNLKTVDEQAFSELYSLKNLILTDNPKLQYFSKYAFKPMNELSEKKYELEILSLDRNNLTTLADLTDSPWLTFETLSVSQNMWFCDCNLKWLNEYKKRGPLHCVKPDKFRDMEIERFFHSNNCQILPISPVNGNYHNMIVTIFILFLLGLGLAIFLQKTDYLRRLLWKDQYGSIYYTKARFPTDTL